MAMKIYFTEEQEQEMIRLFNERINLRKIGDVFGVTTPTIKRILAKYNIKPKQRRHDVNEEYFDVIDTEEKAYWLGFLGADGCIRRRVNDKNGKIDGYDVSKEQIQFEVKKSFFKEFADVGTDTNMKLISSRDWYFSLVHKDMLYSFLNNRGLPISKEI